MASKQKRIKIIIVDDQELIRQGVGAILQSCPHVQIIAEANCGEKALHLIREFKPDICLMDIRMPGIGGLEAIRKIVRSSEGTKVIALSSFYDDPVLHQVIDSGAMGFLTKGSDKSELMRAIELVSHNRRYIGADLAQRLAFDTVNHTGPEDSPFKGLSEREFQIMLMLTAGQKSCDISDKLCLSPKTVSTYRHRLLSKLDVSNDVELTHFAIKHGLLNLDELSDLKSVS
jgi:two-component system invasion response regulator UvrY